MYPKPSKMLAVLYAGTLMGVVSAVPFLNFLNCCCCAGILGGVVLAVFFYKQNFHPQMPRMNSSDCLTVGALAGVVGAFTSFLLSGIFLTIFGNVAKEFIINQMQNSKIPFPPDALDTLKDSLNDVKDGFSFLSLIVSLIFYPIFGLLGGLIGWGIFKPKYNPQFEPSPFQQQMQVVYPQMMQEQKPIPPTIPPDSPSTTEENPPTKKTE